MSDTAEMVRSIRKKNGWSVKELASRCGVSHRTVENWEQGRPVTGPALLLIENLDQQEPAQSHHEMHS